MPGDVTPAHGMDQFGRVMNPEVFTGALERSQT